MLRRFTFILPGFVETLHGDKADHATRGATEIRIAVAAHDEQEAAQMVSEALGTLLEAEMKRRKVEEARASMHSVPREGGQ
jgi:alpha-D-ribose 1-methylphosphonate 5-triphosphate diphosphatase PhnM